jgi:uncharacterized SAM-binding protein YcdF (DUF218 family)
MYHLVVQLLQPYTFLLLGLVGAAAWAWGRKSSRRTALVVAGLMLSLLVFLSTPLAGFLALRTLEGSPQGAAIEPRSEDTIVVLSGSMFRDDDAGEHMRVGPDTFYRCCYATQLYKQAGRCRLLLSGGKVDFSEPGPTLSQVMRDFVIELGIDPKDVVLEERSSTTFQNASFSKALLERPEGRIFLVTDAAHMPRAQLCFEQQGVAVIPAPCNYGARRLEWSIKTFLPSVEGIKAVNYASHEWQGLVWYRLRSLFRK